MNWITFLILVGFAVETETQRELSPMPTLESVGPQAMPEIIAPVQPPFEMPQPQRPRFPSLTVDISQRGASPGLDHLVTGQIQRCIDEVAEKGGGTVLVPKGMWLTGRIELKSGVNLHLADGSELHFSGEILDYLPAVRTRYEGLDIMGLGGLIYAYGQNEIGLTGRGVLVGPDAGPVREIWPGLTDLKVDLQLPIEQRVFDGQDGREYFRPYFVCFVNCKDVLVERVTLRNAPMWNVVPVYCNRVVIRGVKVESLGVSNGDGVNIVSSRNVLVEYCDMATGDDCYALKAGRGVVGPPVENVVLRHNYASAGFGGVTCGSETAGGLRNIYARDCFFHNVRHALYFKTRRPRGGGCEHFMAERIVFTAVHHAILFDMLGLPIYVGELANRLPPRQRTDQTPYYRDITLRRIDGVSQKDAFKIKGIPESPAQRITLKDSHIRSEGAINLTDATDVRIGNSGFHCSSSEIILCDVAKLHLQDVQFKPDTTNWRIEASGPNTREIIFTRCSPQLSSFQINTTEEVSEEEFRETR